MITKSDYNEFVGLFFGNICEQGNYREAFKNKTMCENAASGAATLVLIKKW